MKLKSFLLTLLSFALISPVQAATLIVTTTSDTLDTSDNHCSIRKATINMNNRLEYYAECSDSTSDGYGVNDTIVLESGETYTLDLTDSSSESAETNDLNLFYDFILTTDGSERATIQANFSSTNANTRLLLTSTANLTLENITFKNGRLDASTQEGSTGANVLIYGEGGQILIENCSFENGNITSTLGGYGAGLYFDEANSSYTTTLTIQNSEFLNNSISVTNPNLSNGAYVKGGGAMINDAASVTMENVEFSGNDIYRDNSFTWGGGLHLFNTENVTINNSRFSSNTASGSTPGGSAFNIYAYTPSNDINIAITNSIFSDNIDDNPSSQQTAAYSAPILCRVYSNSYAVNLSFTNTTISNNTSSELSGALFNRGCDVKISHSTIYGNEGYNSGGIYALSGNVSLINTLLANNTLTSNQNSDCYANASFGGTLTSYGNNFISNTINCTLTQNSSTQNADILDQEITLASLADNGGDTQTHAFSSAPNDAIDGGTCLDVDGNTITTDQRGEDRTQGLCDIGAFEQIFYEDADGDGYGGPNSNSTTTYNANFLIDNSDCDDNEATAYPGNGEICGDNIDNDCDGDTDETEDEICDDNVDNDCDGDFDENECIDLNPSSGSSGGSNSNGGSNNGSGSSNDDTCDTNSEDCDNGLVTDETSTSSGGGCQLHSKAMSPMISLGLFGLSLFLLTRIRKKQQF